MCCIALMTAPPPNSHQSLALTVSRQRQSPPLPRGWRGYHCPFKRPASARMYCLMCSHCPPRPRPWVLLARYQMHRFLVPLTRCQFLLLQCLLPPPPHCSPRLMWRQPPLPYPFPHLQWLAHAHPLRRGISWCRCMHLVSECCLPRQCLGRPPPCYLVCRSLVLLMHRLRGGLLASWPRGWMYCSLTPARFDRRQCQLRHWACWLSQFL